MGNIDFINSIGSLAVKVASERGYGNAQVWTCIAQACLESGFGTSKIMTNANGYFGIKATDSWIKKSKYGGLVYNSKTKECYDGKNYTNITACFRAYKNKEDSVKDYFDLLELPRYKSSLSRKTVLECITDIKNGGYATSPTYIQSVMNIYNQYSNDIEKFRVNNVTQEKTIKDILIDIDKLINELISRC